MTKIPIRPTGVRPSFGPALPIVLAAFLAFPALAPAQERFARTYGGIHDDRAWAVQETDDGGYILAGLTWSFAPPWDDVYLVKTDAAGDTLWARAYGGGGVDEARSVQQTVDGGYIVAGFTQSHGAGRADVYLVRTDTAGDTLWTRTYGGEGADFGYDVRQTADLGFVVAGVTHSFGAGAGDAYLVKTDAAGDTLWTAAFGGAAFDGAYSVDLTTDGGYVMAGETESFGEGAGDVVLIKADRDGSLVWTRTFGGAEADVGLAIRRARDGGHIVAGSTRSMGAGLEDVYLVRIDSSGNGLWETRVGGPAVDIARDVRETRDGGFIVAGFTESFGAGHGDVYLVRTDADGDTLWTRTFGGSDADVGRGVRQTTDGGYIVAGGTMSSGAGDDDVYLVKTDPGGITGIGGDARGSDRVPRPFRLGQNRPNPFNPSTTIAFTLGAPPAGGVSLVVYDLRGRRVRTLVGSPLPAGDHAIRWDGRDDRGMPMPSGVYVYRLEVGGMLQARKMTLMK